MKLELCEHSRCAQSGVELAVLHAMNPNALLAAVVVGLSFVAYPSKNADACSPVVEPQPRPTSKPGLSSIYPLGSVSSAAETSPFEIPTDAGLVLGFRAEVLTDAEILALVQVEATLGSEVLASSLRIARYTAIPGAEQGAYLIVSFAKVLPSSSTVNFKFSFTDGDGKRTENQVSFKVGSQTLQEQARAKANELSIVEKAPYTGPDPTSAARCDLATPVQETQGGGCGPSGPSLTRTAKDIYTRQTRRYVVEASWEEGKLKNPYLEKKFLTGLGGPGSENYGGSSSIYPSGDVPGEECVDVVVTAPLFGNLEVRDRKCASLAPLPAITPAEQDAFLEEQLEGCKASEKVRLGGSSAGGGGGCSMGGNSANSGAGLVGALSVAAALIRRRKRT
jgi:MYXO-CTERM domain-containing protein